MARSESAISAIFASTALASSSLVATDFRSLMSSFIAARSSFVINERCLLVAVVVFAVFCVAFVGLIVNFLRFALRLLLVLLIAALRTVAVPPLVRLGRWRL